MKEKIKSKIKKLNLDVSRKTKKGITLIALVITIIILLILAGVTIATIGENGLISRAQEASFKTKMSGYNEEVIEYTVEKYLSEEDNSVNSGDVLKDAIKEGIVTDITVDDVTIYIKEIIKDIGKKRKGICSSL